MGNRYEVSLKNTYLFKDVTGLRLSYESGNNDDEFFICKLSGKDTLPDLPRWLSYGRVDAWAYLLIRDVETAWKRKRK